MKQIDAYIESIYQNIDDNSKEIQELKEEMRVHLAESVHELRMFGKTEQEAVDIAIQKFGGEKEIRSIVDYLFKMQKVFAKWVLITSLSFLLICGSLLGVVVVKEDKMVSIENSIFNQIVELIEGKESLSPHTNEKIKSLLENKDNIKSVKIINSENTVENIFNYEKKTKSPKWLYSYFTNINSNDTWTLLIEIRRFSDFVFIALLAGMAVYSTLFTIWATINAYHHKRLNIVWIIFFVLFNVLGYLIYVLVGNKIHFSRKAF